jgi:hypothetical protein
MRKIRNNQILTYSLTLGLEFLKKLRGKELSLRQPTNLTEEDKYHIKMGFSPVLKDHQQYLGKI